MRFGTSTSTASKLARRGAPRSTGGPTRQTRNRLLTQLLASLGIRYEYAYDVGRHITSSPKRGFMDFSPLTFRSEMEIQG